MPDEFELAGVPVPDNLARPPALTEKWFGGFGFWIFPAGLRGELFISTIQSAEAK